MAGGRTLIAFGAAFLWLFVVVAWLGSDRGKAFAGSADPAVPASRSPRRLAPRGLSKLSALSPNNNKTSNSSPLAQFLSKAQPRVPKLVHFIYGLDQSRVPEFGFIQWLSIVSAYESIRPERIFFWHRGEPRGEWWERAKHFITDRRQARDVTSVFGNPIANYAHKADILRLEILIEHGGIYLDQDTVVWRSLDELLGYECVMGHEGEGGWVGLGNAVIIAQPRSRFLSRWLRSYHNFDDANWNYHSIILPRILAAENPREVHVLDYTRFFWPLWNENGLQKFYVEKVYDFGKLGFTNHLWESKALRFVLSDAANAPTLEQVDLPIYCGMRRFLKVQPPGPRMKDSSGAYCWHNQEAPAEMPEPEPACRILDGPLDNSTLVSYYDFDRDRDHPLKLLDSSGHHLNGWFLSFRTPDVQDVSQIPGFATYPPPFGTVRSFDGSRGDYAILPTLRTYGQSFHAFTLSLWLRFDSQAAATADRMAVAEVVGDCDTFGTHDRCPSLHVQLKRAKRAPAPFQLGKANREANQRPVQGKTDGPWICEAAMHERRAGDSWIVVKLARIDVWEGVKEHMLPDVWYRVQVSASRRSQKLRLQVWKGAFEGAARFTVEKIADLSNGYYTPSSIVPVRFRNIWLGGPWHLLKDAHDASNYFTGQMDRVVISSTEVENAEDLAEGRTSLDLAPSFGVVDAAELELRQQDDLDSMLRAAGSGSRLRKRLAGAPVPMSLSERARQVLDSLILAAALEPVTFIFVVFGPLGVYLLRSSRRLRKFAWMGFLGFLTVVVVLEAGCLLRQLPWERLPAAVAVEAAKADAKVDLADVQLLRQDLASEPAIQATLNESTPNASNEAAELEGRDSEDVPRPAKPAKGSRQIALLEQPLRPWEPRIAVIMPCHKQAIYIRDALRSVFRQSYASWDLIVVDDRSPDRCGRVAVREVRSRFRDYEETSERRNTRLMPEDFLVRHMDLTVTSFRGAQGRTIQVVENHDNCGLSCSRNLAILLTDAPYILTLDADDLIHQSYLRIAVSALQTNPALGIVTGATQQFFGASNWTWWLPEWSPRAVLDRGPFPVATVYRRADWARIGGYNPLLPWGNEDWTFWIALSWLPGMQVHKLKGEYWPGKGMGKGESTSSYRYKAASMARSKEEHAEECEAMMRTIHSALYGPERTLEAHSLLLTRGSLQMRELVEAAVARAGTGKALGRQSEAALWLGLWWEGRAEEDGEGGLKAEALREARDWYVRGIEHGLAQRASDEGRDPKEWLPSMRAELPDDWQLWWRAGIATAKLGELSLGAETNVTLSASVEIAGIGSFTCRKLCEEALARAGQLLAPRVSECHSPASAAGTRRG